MNLSSSIIESSLHYNQLNAREKFEVCRFLDYELHFISPALFSDGFRRKFENAKKNKARNAWLYPFGVIPEIADNLDFRNLLGKNLQLICHDLYKLDNVRLAKYTAEILEIGTDSQLKELVKENRELVRDYNELLRDYKISKNKDTLEITYMNFIVDRLMRKSGIEIEEYREIQKEVRAKDLNYLLPFKDVLEPVNQESQENN